MVQKRDFWFRSAFWCKAAAVKGEAGVALYDPKREEEILQRVAEENAGPIYDTTMREIFEIIMHRIRDLESHR